MGEAQTKYMRPVSIIEHTRVSCTIRYVLAVSEERMLVILCVDASCLGSSNGKGESRDLPNILLWGEDWLPVLTVCIECWIKPICNIVAQGRVRDTKRGAVVESRRTLWWPGIAQKHFVLRPIHRSRCADTGIPLRLECAAVCQNNNPFSMCCNEILILQGPKNIILPLWTVRAFLIKLGI